MRLIVRCVLALSVLAYVASAYAAVTVSVNGVNHTIPQTGEKGWGANVTAWIQAISANTLQPSGGNFTLTADTNFGGSFGLVSTYYKSRAASVSTVGAIRIGTTESIGWRNNANDGNLLLTTDSSDRLLFNGVLLPSLAASDFTDSGLTISNNSDATKKFKFDAVGIGTTTTRTLTVPDASGTLVLADNTQTLTGKTLDGDDNTFSDIGYGSLDLTGSLVDADIDANAGIGVSKLEALTASRAVVTDGDGFLSAATTTATELGYVNGVTSAIQTQLDARVPKSAFTAKGDILIGTTASTYTTKSVGTDGLFLQAASGETGGVTWASPSGAPLAVTTKTTTYTATTSDDVILASGSAFTITLYAASGNSGKVLRIKKTDSSLTNIITIDGNSTETIDGAETTTLNTQYEEVTLVCDGSNWHILSRTYPQVWVAYTPTFTGFGTVSGVSFYSRRVGDSLHIHGVFTSGTSTATQARITLGYNGTNANVTSAGTSKISSSFMVVGSGAFATAAASNFYVVIQPSVGYLNLGLAAAGSAGFAAANGDALLANGQIFSLYVTVPIAGWN